MNIALYTHESFAYFILYCIIFGIASFVIHCIMGVVFSAPAICKCTNVTLLKVCIRDLTEGRLKKRHSSDFLSILVIAISLLIVSFIANSGEFRIVSIPLLLVGFALGRFLFKRIIIIVMSALCYLSKKIALLLLTPVIMLIRALIKVAKRIIAIVQKHCIIAQIEKYTKKRYMDLDKIKQTGLLEHLFEVV